MIPTPAISAEQNTFLAVIEQAVRDVRNLDDHEKHVAWAFLTDKVGNWARSRRDICDAIGIDSEVLRTNCLEGLEAP